MEKNNNTFHQGKRDELCPFCHKPFVHCYSRSLNSESIEKVLKFCSSNFTDCEIYKANLHDTTADSDALNRGYRFPP